MRVIILTIGKVEEGILGFIQNGLSKVFPRSLCNVSDVLPIPENAFNVSRRQYVSTMILSGLHRYAEKTQSQNGIFNRVLGVTNIDLYVLGLNFVFGEAECPGKAALISFFRLRPEFYRQPSDERLLHERALKEAMHELGHTLGLRHCENPTCVMHFSLHIGMTDQKKAEFCNPCDLKANY